MWQIFRDIPLPHIARNIGRSVRVWCVRFLRGAAIGAVGSGRTLWCGAAEAVAAGPASTAGPTLSGVAAAATGAEESTRSAGTRGAAAAARLPGAPPRLADLLRKVLEHNETR